MKIRVDPEDRLFSQLIRIMFPICQACHKMRSTQVHHWKGRRHQSVRFDFDNAWAVDFGCHRKFEEDSDFAMRMQKKRLGDKYDAFVIKAASVCKRHDCDKKLIRKWLRAEIVKLGETPVC